MTQVTLSDEGLEIKVADPDSAAKMAAYLVVVLKAVGRGSSFLISEGDLGRALRSIRQFCDKSSIAISLDEPSAGLLADLERMDREFEDARAQAEEATRDAAMPLGQLVRVLKPKQLESVAHLLRIKNGADFSVPGAGKTTVAYSIFAALQSEGVVDRMIVVCPRSAFVPWEDEFEECFGRRPVVARLSGDLGSRQQIYARVEDYELVLLTYQMAANDTRRIAGICRRHAVLLILDESHNVKRLDEGQWSEAVLSLAPIATRRLIMTGTPMPQGYEDLWTQFTFLWPGRNVLGEKNSYRRKCETGDTDDIKALVRPFFRRVTKNDLNLPKLDVVKVRLDLAPEQARIYDAIRQSVLRDLDLQPPDRRVLRRWRRARLVRLLQAASNPDLLPDYSSEFGLPTREAVDSTVVEIARRYKELNEIPAKFGAAVEILVRLFSEGKKAVVWTSFVKNIGAFSDLIPDDVPRFIVYGDVPRDYSEDEEFNREQQIAEFKSTSGPAVLVANPAACGESISLHHACTDAIYLDRTFDCAKYLQSQDRIHRLGLDESSVVTARILICTDTIDETVEDRLEIKATRMAAVLDEELPEGTLEDIDESDSEQELDFDATIRDLRREGSARAVSE